MSNNKKDFSGGLNTVLSSTTNGATVKKKAGRPATGKKAPANTSQEGTKETETRFTSIASLDHLGKIDAVAYWDRKTKKEVLAEALEEYFKRYEKKNGAIKPAPKK